ncbi:MAG TPA: hypothetical protein VG435_16365 [Acidimicrobiales bacterium]|nr:hypothetical protein [Acidimicrobiales bacterium]
MTTDHYPQILDLQTAAEYVDVSPFALKSLVTAGYVDASRNSDAQLRFTMSDLKAFVARNSDNGSSVDLPGDLVLPALEPSELVELLDDRAEHMALRMLKMYSTVFPQVQSWPPARLSKFVTVTRARFKAILAVALSEKFDQELLDDLHHIGSSAAKHEVKLPEILLLLRVSRDLVVQNAIEVTESDDRPSGFALSLLLTRIMPAMDRLADALTAGYWETMFPGQ